MNEESIYAATVLKLTKAVHEAFEPQRHPFPALILLYASIDIISSLNRPVNCADTNSRTFIEWVDSYMLPGANLKCRGADVYAARCGILHTLSLDSRNFRLGDARRISYVSEEDEVDAMQLRIDPTEKGDVVVDLTRFGQSFLDGISAFSNKVESDAATQGRVFHHVQKLAAFVVLRRNPK